MEDFGPQPKLVTIIKHVPVIPISMLHLFSNGKKLGRRHLKFGLQDSTLLENEGWFDVVQPSLTQMPKLPHTKRKDRRRRRPRKSKVKPPAGDGDFNAVPLYIGFLAVFLVTGLIIGTLVAANNTSGINYSIITVPGSNVNKQTNSITPAGRFMTVLLDEIRLPEWLKMYGQSSLLN